MAIKELISKDQDSLALEIIKAFKNSKYEYNKFTKGAVNMLHLIGSEIYIKKGELEEAKQFISTLSMIRSPQLLKIVNLYNNKAKFIGVDTIDINLLLSSSIESGKKINLSHITTNRGLIQIESNKKYLFLFLNEDCNACNLTINDIVTGIANYDGKSEMFETILVCDEIKKLEAEYPGHTIAINPSELRHSLAYYSKSGTILVENLKIIFDSPNIPTKTKDFLEYIFEYSIAE